MYEFHSLLNLELLKVEKASTDFTATLILSFRYELVCAYVIFLKCEGVLFIKLIKEILRLEFLEFLDAGRRIVTAMHGHELILFKLLVTRLLNCHLHIMLRWQSIVLDSYILLGISTVVTFIFVEAIVWQNMFLIRYWVVQCKWRLWEIALTLIIKLEVNRRRSLNYFAIHFLMF